MAVLMENRDHFNLLVAALNREIGGARRVEPRDGSLETEVERG